WRGQATAPVRAGGRYGDATGTGLATSTAVTVVVVPSDRTSFTETRSPGWCWPIRVPRPSDVVTGLPSKATMTSPGLTPACAAGPPGAVWTTSAPLSTLSPSWTATPGPTV